MRSAKSVRVVLTLLGALGAVVGLSLTVLAGPPKQSYSISVPAQTVNQPTSGYAVADFSAKIVPGSGGYDDPVTLSYKGLPPGVTADWDQTPVVQVNGEPLYDDTRDLHVQVPPTLKVGTYQFTIHSVNADSGKDAHDTQVTLGVAAPLSPASTFSLGVTPSSVAIPQGQTASFKVTLNLPSGYNGGAVTLSVGGLPGGTQGTFSPKSLATSSSFSTLTIPTTAKTKSGQFNLKITGTSSKTHVDVLVTLTIQRLTSNTAFTLVASPAQQQIAAGGTTSFSIGISRADNFTDAVDLTVSGLPASTVATWDASPASYLGNAASITISTDEALTPDGTFNLVITGSAGSASQTTTAKLVVQTPNGKSVGITGNAIGTLYMQAPPTPIDLQISNPNDKNIWVTNVTVAVSGTSKQGCGIDDFDVTQFSGGYPLTIAKRASSSLSGLGVDQQYWPQIALHFKPTTNQDSCKDATVYLAYTASAREAG